MRRLRKGRIFSALFVVAFGAYAIRASSLLKPFLEVAPLAVEGCVTVPGVAGAEDMAIDPSNGQIYMTSFDPSTAPVMVREQAGGSERGGLYTLSSTRADAVPQKLELGTAPKIRGHGLAFWADPVGGEKRLFVVNHGVDGEAIEIFRIESPSKLVHLESVKDPAFINLNDVAPVGARRFYTSNDHGHPRGFLQRVEEFSFIGQASLVYFDGQTGRVVKDGLGFANGVLASADGKRLYLVESTHDRLWELEPTDSGALRTVGMIHVDLGLDNLAFLNDGSLLVVAHPSAGKFLRYAGDHSRASPFRVYHVSHDPSGALAARLILADDGSHYSAATVALPRSDHVLLGGVFAESLWRCPLPDLR